MGFLSQFQTCFWTIILFLFMVLNCHVNETALVLPKNVTVSAVFVFGDSIVDPGNNNNLPTIAKGNFLPYGRDFKDGPTGRFSNGRVPSDLIAEEFGVKGLVPAYLDPKTQLQDLLTGVSFASGAAGYDPLTAKTANVIPMSGQLELFKECIKKIKGGVGEERAATIISEAIYIDLYGLGARRIGLLGLPPIGCVPSQRTIGGGKNRDCYEAENQLAIAYNAKLSGVIDSLKAVYTLPDTKLIFLDIYYPLLSLIQNPAKYGFEVATKGCCGTGLIEASIFCNPTSIPLSCPDASKYVFWDGYHPSEKAYKILVPIIINTHLNEFF
ncbi:GDSL esterase/lipase EXL3-like isoform X2 [Gossypium arboreum]|uniref:GDSL esterase/lipase EXL3-like isoform X2 n=1 Tax=Gossypium arboreum TaxID=29729 RepID=UPI0022F19C11|nr:GDSL esterase/lipase EXL3-like isoform X2 [Gossypium arboreum]